MGKFMLAWSRLVVVHACKVFFVGMFLVFGLAGTGIALLLAGGTTIDGGTEEFVVQNSAVAQRSQAEEGRYNDHPYYRQLHFLSDGKPTPEKRRANAGKKRRANAGKKRRANAGEKRRAYGDEGSDGLLLTLFYESKDGGSLLTTPRLQQLVEAEKRLLADFAAEFDPGSEWQHHDDDGYYESCDVVLEGYSCDNGYGSDPDDQSYLINQNYVLYGYTANDRPYYCGVDRPSMCLFYDEACEDGMEGSWIIGCDWPDESRARDVQGGGGGGCCNSLHITDDSYDVPFGTHDVWRWCGDSGASGSQSITLSRCEMTRTPAPPAPPPVAARSPQSVINMALDGTPPKTLARLLFEATSDDWHYTTTPLGGVSVEDRVTMLGLHAADTALMSEDNEARQYCAKEDVPSTCVDSLQVSGMVSREPCAEGTSKPRGPPLAPIAATWPSPSPHRHVALP